MDFETYSEAGHVWTEPTAKYPLGRWEAPEGAKKPGIGAVGAPAYAEHPSTEVLTLSYDLCDGRGIRRWQPGQPNPQDLFDHVLAGGPIEAHNAMFERLICEKVCEPKYGWPRFPAEAWRCSMATALVAQRPAALAPLALVLQLADQKDKEGTRLIHKFCVPQQPIVGLVDKKTGRVKRPDQPARRIRPEDDPEDFKKLCAYCDQDVRTEMAAADAMPPMEPHEIIAWQFTQDMNYRGLAVDRAGLRACIGILKQVLDQYGRECERITGLKVTQLEKMKEWLAGYGVQTTSLDADALVGLLARDDLHPTARRVLELRERTGSASVKKTLAIEARCNADDRLRDIVVHHGTRPGRPSGEGPQPLNLPKAGPKLTWCDCGKPSAPTPCCPWCGEVKSPAARKVWQSDMVDHVLEVMALGSLGMVENFFGDAMTAIQGCVRGLFQAAPGHLLVSTDYSSLQAVVAACLAGEQWRIDAFTRGDPIYLLGASKITGKPLEFYLDWFEQHGDHHVDRQKIGKVSELACLSPETLVLTTRGYISITAVTLDDMLWDGIEWVTHRGLIDRGVRSVVSLDGTRMTPDHLVSVNGSWLEAKKLASDENILSQALATGSANLPSSMGAGTPWSSDAIAAGSRIRQHGPTYVKGPLLGAISVPAPKRGSAEVKITGDMQISYRISRTAEGFLTAFQRASLGAVRVILRKARSITPRGAFMFTMFGATARKAAGYFWPTWSPCPVGISLSWNWTGSTPMGITNPGISGLSPARKICRTSVPSEICKRSSTATSNVYDIANAGPRNRFTIKSKSGHLIVHNCGFQGWINSYRAFGSDEPDEVIREQILAWRAASPAIVEMWGGQWRGPPWRRERPELYGLEGKFIAAVQNPGQRFDYRGISFCMEEKDCLVIRLPQIDGIRRPLRYHEPRLTPSARNRDELSISYSTWNTNPNYGARGWVRMPTWGGRIFENCVMGVEVDIQRFGAKLMERHGYPLVLSVYDENVAEIPVDKPLTLGLPPVEGLDPYVQEIEHLLSIMPPELEGWPIRASGGWKGVRYRKS